MKTSKGINQAMRNMNTTNQHKIDTMQASHYTDGTGIPTATGTPPALPTAERDLKLSLSATRAALTEALAALEFVAEYLRHASAEG